MTLPIALASLAALTLPNLIGQQPKGQPGQMPPNYGAYEWVDPDTVPLPGTLYKTFHSATVKGDVSYLIYLPPDYDKQTDMRYPVLYGLPASGGTPKRDGAEIVRRANEAIRSSKILPMIVVMVNGLRGNTMYCDSRDGKWPLETVIIKDLIPHIDATYRTIAAREGRAVDGFSMGGFGAAHLGFKFPEVFGVISIMAPPLLGPDLKQHLPMQAWSRLFPLAMNSDLEYFKANDPFTLVEKNADALRDRTVIRIVCHWENEQWLWPRCEQLHQLLVKNLIQHEFYFLTNVKGHNPVQCMNTMGDSAFGFFSSSLVHKSTPPAGARARN
jgi:endo-1,4-beta-xylanase